MGDPRSLRVEVERSEGLRSRNCLSFRLETTEFEVRDRGCMKTFRSEGGEVS